MRRLQLPALLAPVALVWALAGCGAPAAEPATLPDADASTSSSPASSSPAVAGPVGGIPALSGDPSDLTAPTQAGPGNGEPPTELLLEDVVVGEGPAATPADTVDVRYTGTLWTDGSVFDSSWSRGDEPIQFPLSGVIDGFAQGIDGMAPGGRRVIVMPPDLAYGENPQGGAPGGTLVFVVDLVAIS
jgi:peptidylprolyl isomerase